MASSLPSVSGHLPTLLPDGPPATPFTDANWTTLLAIMDAVLPSIRREGSPETRSQFRKTITDTQFHDTITHLKETVVDAPDSKALDEYLDERPSDIPRFRELLKRTLGDYVPQDARKGLGIVLASLDTRVGSMLLTGYTTPFHAQPIVVREAILESWRLSYLPPLNKIFKQMTVLAKSLWLKTSPTFQALSGFPPLPHHSKPGSSHDYRFLQFEPGTEPETIDTDVVIVGSGCGGAVCAKNLAEAGHRVLLVDKAYHFAPAHLPMTEEAAGIHLFENGGAELSVDGSTSVVAGASWGGGGTVNWSASLQTQSFVRKEWAQDRGLTFFETAEFQKCLDRVCHRMGASTEHVRHNYGNQVLLEGARKLGYHAKAVPQNTGGTEHYCGHCTLGCGSGQKQGPGVSWLPDAAKAGAEFVEGLTVDHVVFDEANGAKKAVGVTGKWVSRNSSGGVDGPSSGKTVREVIVRAKKVIISCGSLWSPIILLNSGLKNPQIGRNLYLHPVNTVNAVFKEDVRPWEGGILTSVCTTFENLDQHGHGAKLETTSMLPSWNLVLLPWTSGLAYKTLALKFRHMTGFISIARDRDPGLVYRDAASGRPRIQYSPSAFDRAHILEGVLAVCRIAYVQGAREIHLTNAAVPPFLRGPPEDGADPSITDPAFAAWLTDVQRIGNKAPLAFFASAHQMGSNRMSVVPADGVVDPEGRVWGAEGLYVADASVFPSASGVNPMVTVMAICDHISRRIGREMEDERRGGE
ncbi:hypothetical protein QTJ16_001014 [Diplocarpon rosae]|uniref:Long-chain-alcohol oxidase n=1 Tax=Diplocarpon rosae TaxID=946125 RepID=A0AAD9T7E3_9HELO|nr:hypothetical protein QTJ16_001014 [Diplocarpon rosae]